MPPYATPHHPWRRLLVEAAIAWEQGERWDDQAWGGWGGCAGDGTREPRKPVTPSLTGAIALPLPINENVNAAGGKSLPGHAPGGRR